MRDYLVGGDEPGGSVDLQVTHSLPTARMREAMARSPSGR